MTRDEALALLGVENGAPADEVKRAYARRAREHPPDREPDVFKRIREAYDVLRGAEPATDPLEASAAPAPRPDEVMPLVPEPGFADRPREDLVAALDAPWRDLVEAAVEALLTREAYAEVAVHALDWARLRAAYEPAPRLLLTAHTELVLRLLGRGEDRLAGEVLEAARLIRGLELPSAEDETRLLIAASVAAVPHLGLRLAIAEELLVHEPGRESWQRLSHLAVADPDAARTARIALGPAAASSLTIRQFLAALDPPWSAQVAATFGISTTDVDQATTRNAIATVLFAVLVFGSLALGCAGGLDALSLVLPIVAIACCMAVYGLAMSRHPGRQPQAMSWLRYALATYMIAGTAAVPLRWVNREDALSVATETPQGADQWLVDHVAIHGDDLQSLETALAGDGDRKIAAGDAIIECALAADADEPTRCKDDADAVAAATAGRCPTVGPDEVDRTRDEDARRSHAVHTEFVKTLARLCTAAK